MKDEQTFFDIFDEFESTETINSEMLDELEMNPEMKEVEEIDIVKTNDKSGLTDELGIIDQTQQIDPEDLIENVSINLDKEAINKIEGYGKVKIMALGIGGCGANTIGRMCEERVEGIRLVAIDTSKQSLEVNSSDESYLMGESIFGGHGSGGQHEKVQQAFQEDKEKIKEILADVDMLFLTGGIGRGTGSVGLTEIGKIAKELGILTIGFATLPKKTEAEESVTKKYYQSFLENVDSNIVIENDRVFNVAKNISINKAVKIADKMLVDGIRGISELITSPGKINLDYADIRTAFQNKGACVMGVGYGHGENAVVDAIEEAINSKIINFENIRNAKVIIFNITCAKNTITVQQATSGTDLIYSYNYNENIDHLLFGYSYDDSLGDEVKVTFVATGTIPTEISYKKIDDISDIFGEMITPNTNKKFSKTGEETTKELHIPDFLTKK